MESRKALIFNGAALEKGSHSTAGIIAGYLCHGLQKKGFNCEVFEIPKCNIPQLESFDPIPDSVREMARKFTETDVQFWLSPLYHGGIPGVMKNCLDWLEITAKNEPAYLTDKMVGMVCWADGIQAMQGINSMCTIANALRAWPMPFSIPIIRRNLFQENNPMKISDFYKRKLDLMIDIAATRNINSEEKEFIPK